MADVNWRRYNCNICLAVSLSAAAVASAVAAWILHSIGLPVVLLVILFLVVWGVLLLVVDGWCGGRYPQEEALAGNAAVTADAEKAMADARAAEANAAEDAAAAEKAVAAADAKAAEEANAAAEAAAAEKAAADAKAAEEARAAAKAAAAEKAAQDARAAEDAAEAQKDAETDSGDAGGGAGEGSRPVALEGPRGGTADDLKRIKGIGPKLEQVCNSLGFYHFDQIAAWTADEIAWVDSNLEGFRGRVTRDDWVAQAKQLAAGGETEFSKRVDEGDVPSSQ